MQFGEGKMALVPTMLHQRPTLRGAIGVEGPRHGSQGRASAVCAVDLAAGGGPSPGPSHATRAGAMRSARSIADTEGRAGHHAAGGSQCRSKFRPLAVNKEISCATLMKAFKGLKIDQIELWISADAETAGVLKLAFSAKGKGGVQIVLKPKAQQKGERSCPGRRR